MIEEMQTGMSAAQATTVSSQIQKRVPGGIMQHEQERNKCGNQGGTVNRKNGRKQNNSNKREVASNRGTKKAQGEYTKKSGDFLNTGNQRYINPENLLNFHFMPLRSNQGGSPSFQRRRVTFNKEAFLQANCHFVVDGNEEKYKVHSIDPDVLVEWEAIQLVYLPTHETPCCPICLYPPAAAKITKCGHVYCWTCVLHYLSLSEKSWGKCPICFESVHENDLKSVISVVQNKFSRSGTITMKLMKRPKNSLVAYPVEDWDETKTEFPVWEGKPVNPTCKLTTATQQIVLENILMREKIELTASLSEAIQEQTGEENFIRTTLEKLEAKIRNYSPSSPKASIKPAGQSEPERKDTDYIQSNLQQVLATKESTVLCAFSEDEDESSHSQLQSNQQGVTRGNQDQPTLDQLEEKLLPSVVNGEKKTRNSESCSTNDSMCELDEASRRSMSKPTDFYYFYQAEDGQNIFINSLNARCLIEEYTCLEQAPKKIVGQILDFESYTMTKELRRRYRYLSHLPVCCEFIICELMLRPPVLSKHTIHNFMGEFKKRKALRNKKMEEQRKHDLRADAELSRRAGYRVQTLDEYEVQLDLTDLTDFPSHISPTDICMDNNNQRSEGGGDEEHADQMMNTQTSFAQMLKISSQSPSTSDSTASHVVGAWPHHHQVPHLLTRSLHGANDDIDDDDENSTVAAPSLKEMFTAAMFTPAMTTNTSSDNTIGRNNRKKGKKGKAKGTLLFATGAQRKY